MTEEETTLKAGRLMKIVRLASTPGMDAVSVKLNCALTYEEKQGAKMWATAFELAQTDRPLFELAQELHQRHR